MVPPRKLWKSSLHPCQEHRSQQPFTKLHASQYPSVHLLFTPKDFNLKSQHKMYNYILDYQIDRRALLMLFHDILLKSDTNFFAKQYLGHD